MKLDLRIIVDLAIKFPNLEFLGYQTRGFEWYSTSFPNDDDEHEGELRIHFQHDWAGPRHDARHDFAEAVASCHSRLPKSLKCDSLDFLGDLDNAINIHHGKGQPDLVSPAKTDSFSSSLRLLTNNLRQLQLRAVVDESLFWPDGNAEFPWPNLEKLEAVFHMVRPDGTWHFQGLGGEGSLAVGSRVTEATYPSLQPSEFDEQMDDLWEDIRTGRGIGGNHQFCISPASSLRRFLKGFARAATNMRALNTAAILSPMTWHPYIYDHDDEAYWGKYRVLEENDRAWGIIYEEPGFHRGSALLRKLEWLTWRWRPNSGLSSLFRQMGLEKHGEGLEEIWADEVGGDYFPLRDEFEHRMYTDDPGHISLSR